MREIPIRLMLLAVVGLYCSIACGRPEPVQTPVAREAAPAVPAANAPVYMCPMDKDIRSHDPGACPRCGMTLVTAIPDPVEYQLDLTATPAPRSRIPVRLKFEVFDPWKGNLVTKFTPVHEKLFHAFIVSRDLQFFVHGHPMWDGGAFNYDVTLPKPGMYRVLGDFYPEASTPQLIAKTLFVAGEESRPGPLGRDYSRKQAENLSVELSTTPEAPIAGMSTQLRLTVGPAEGLERYLGVWSHMLAASDDLIDMMHTHPSIADGGPEILFTLVFPRVRTYRVWVQFQRNGVINTAHFDIPVRQMPPGPIAAAARHSKSVGHS
jgi:heavy metal-binding protein